MDKWTFIVNWVDIHILKLIEMEFMIVMQPYLTDNQMILTVIYLFMMQPVKCLSITNEL